MNLHLRPQRKGSNRGLLRHQQSRYSLTHAPSPSSQMPLSSMAFFTRTQRPRSHSEKGGWVRGWTNVRLDRRMGPEPEKCKVKKTKKLLLSDYYFGGKFVGLFRSFPPEAKDSKLFSYQPGYRGPSCQALKEGPKKAIAVWTEHFAQQHSVPLCNTYAWVLTLPADPGPRLQV